MKTARCVPFVVILLLLVCGTAWAQGLPDLPKQELWVKIVSMVVGLVVIFAISIMGINRLLYGALGLEADNATKISIIIGIILSFLWFLYLFGQIFDTMIMIIIGVLLVVIALVYFVRGGGGGSSYSD